MEQSTARGSVVLVLDFGSQYTHLITRRIRQLSICSICLPAGTSLAEISKLNPHVVILSGGPHSVHEEGSPTLPDGFFEYAQEHKVSVLGICYGLHLIVKLLGGEVKQAERQEYGRMEITAVKNSELFGDAQSFPNQVVWMSHGDEAVQLPRGFSVVATSLQGNIAAIENSAAGIYALQYHPEVCVPLFAFCFYLCLPMGFASCLWFWVACNGCQLKVMNSMLILSSYICSWVLLLVLVFWVCL
jgi:GMP synthase (glutamine-hydrolysing)